MHSAVFSTKILTESYKPGFIVPKTTIICEFNNEIIQIQHGLTNNSILFSNAMLNFGSLRNYTTDRGRGVGGPGQNSK